MTQNQENSGILSVILSLIGFIRKYYIILIIGILAGVGMGIRAHYIAKDSAISKLVVSTAFVDNDVVAKLVNGLELYIENNDKSTLAIKMGTLPENLSTLTSLFADTTKTHMNAIKVDMGMTDPSLADSLSKALIYYLNHNKFIASMVELKSRQQKYLIDQNNLKIKEVDSLLNAGKISFNSFEDVAAVNDNYLDLIRSKQEAEYEQAAFGDIRIIEQNVTLLPKRGLKSALLINIIAYTFLAFALSALIEVIRIYIRREKGKKQASTSS